MFCQQLSPPASQYSQSSINETQSLHTAPGIVKPPRVGAKSRSFFQVPDHYKYLTTRAAEHVRQFTLFENPMLNAHDIEQLLLECWSTAQRETKLNLE
jgi:hypothetical protein